MTDQLANLAPLKYKDRQKAAEEEDLSALASEMNMYVVDSIIAERVHPTLRIRRRNRMMQYLVKWAAPYAGVTTWEPEKFLRRTDALARWKEAATSRTSRASQ